MRAEAQTLLEQCARVVNQRIDTSELLEGLDTAGNEESATTLDAVALEEIAPGAGTDRLLDGHGADMSVWMLWISSWLILPLFRRVSTSRASSLRSLAASQRGVSGMIKTMKIMGIRKMHWRMVGTRQMKLVFTPFSTVEKA
jgi:hypothetical protein